MKWISRSVLFFTFFLSGTISSSCAKYTALRGGDRMTTRTSVKETVGSSSSSSSGLKMMDELDGKWLQVYSNLYVQEVLEVDYKCVVADICVDPLKAQMTISKNAFQHFIFPTNNVYHYNISFLDGNNENVTNNMVLTLLYYEDNDILNNHPLVVKKTGPIYQDKYEYLILANLENNIQSVLYIYTRDYNRFMDQYNNEVLKMMHDYNFTSYSTYPMISYIPLCLNK